MNPRSVAKQPVAWPKTPYGRALLVRIGKTMAAWQMVVPGDSVLVAVSGGPDSVCLLLTLDALRPHWALSLAVAHLDHGLRPATAPQEIAFVRGLAANLGLPFHGLRADVAGHAARVRIGIEEAGRELRYDFLEKTARAQGYRRIALGHTADDNAELILMNLLRGAGPTGLCGIPAVRPPLVIRPLIDIRRHQVLDLLKLAGADHLVDPTNTDLRFTRNRIRGQLIPLLENRFNPNTTAALNRLGSIMTWENQYLEQQAAAVLAGAACQKAAHRIEIDLPRIADCHPAIQRRLIRQAIAAVKTDLRRIGFVHTEAVLGLLGKPGGGTLHLPDQVLVTCRGSVVAITREDTPLRSRR